MCVYGVTADAERRGDLLVGLPACDEMEHRQLAERQPVGVLHLQLTLPLALQLLSCPFQCFLGPSAFRDVLADDENDRISAGILSCASRLAHPYFLAVLAHPAELPPAHLPRAIQAGAQLSLER